MQKTPIKLRERKEADNDYTYFAPEIGCNSYVRKQGGRQVLGLQVPGCLKPGVIQHELMHATGFCHEQARTDRDDYFEINWSNIPKDYHKQFQSYTDKEIAAFGRPYDFGSILHYGRFDFAMDPEEWTIRPRKNKINSPGADMMGQRLGLSPTDVEKLQLAYPVDSGSTCPEGDGWKKNENVCYFFSFLTDTHRRPFAGARMFCREKGAVISSEPNERVAEFFKAHINTNLESDTKIYVASCNTITLNNLNEPQETDCTPRLDFICAKRLSVL